VYVLYRITPGNLADVYIVKDATSGGSHEVMNRGGARKNKRYTVRQVRYVKYKTGGTTEK
jgi:hypothetical protein